MSLWGEGVRKVLLVLEKIIMRGIEKNHNHNEGLIIRRRRLTRRRIIRLIRIRITRIIIYLDHK